MSKYYTPVDHEKERASARFCGECPWDECRNCIEAESMEIRNYQFNRALEMGITEEIARKIFKNGHLLEVRQCESAGGQERERQ